MPREYAHVARSFRSVKRCPVQDRGLDEDLGTIRRASGVLVANFTIGPRLIDVDVRQETNVAAVLCPMDRSDPQQGTVDDAPLCATYRFSTGVTQRTGITARSSSSRRGCLTFRSSQSLSLRQTVGQGASSSITTGSARHTWLLSPAVHALAASIGLDRITLARTDLDRRELE